MDTAPARGHLTHPATPTSHPAPAPASQFTLRNYRQRLEYPVNVCYGSAHSDLAFRAWPRDCFVFVNTVAHDFEKPCQIVEHVRTITRDVPGWFPGPDNDRTRPAHLSSGSAAYVGRISA